MASSPTTTFSGAISLDGMITLPITIGKASSETREGSIAQVCDHRDEAGAIVKIDKSERCSRCKGAPKHKAHAVRKSDDDYRVLDATEWNQIEDATKSDILEIQDCQPLSKLPLMYANGTYYVRFNDKAKGAQADAFAHFVAALHREQMGAIVKWGNSARQKLCILHVESGVLLLRVIPFVADIRPASKMERAHWHAELEERKLNQMASFLHAISNSEGFQYASYQDEGLRLRQEAVEAVLNGEVPQEKPEHGNGDEPIDWMTKLEASIDELVTKA